jgi:hypothetical protein
MTKLSRYEQEKLDAICAEGFRALDKLDAVMYGYGWVTRQGNRPKQAPMAFGGSDTKPKGKGPTPLSIVNPHGPTLQPSGGAKVSLT